MSETTPGATTNDVFAAWIKRGRTSAGLSQEDLARRMRDRGHEFVQQTIARIESRNRRVSLGEAVALADALDLNLALFAEHDPASRASMRMQIERQTKTVLASLIEMSQRVADARNALAELRALAAEFDASAGDDVEEWFGERQTATQALAALFEYDDLDGLAWAWNNFVADRPGHALLRRFGLIPASELPIPGYDKTEDAEF
ncbi:helix-turn-helix domain-containing protein [Microbacterium proteolyticum]|nr:helix-turn-helix transcriptional regulator [Microbacterium proteolyticum]